VRRPDTAHPAEQLADRREVEDELGPAVLSADSMIGTDPPPPALIVLTCVAANVIARSRTQPPTAEYAIAVHSPRGAGALGIMGLLAEVGRGVVAREGVHGQQEADRQDEEPVQAAGGEAAMEGAVVGSVPEHERRALVRRGLEDQHEHDHGHAQQHPPR